MTELHSQLNRIHDKLDKQQEVLNTIQISQAQLPCGVQENRLKLLEKLVYGAVALALLSFGSSIFSHVTPVKSEVVTHKIVNNDK